VTGVRETYLRFPAWSQPFWTWYTGKALSGQHPVLRLGWPAYLLLVCGAYFGGLALSGLALAGLTGWFWLPLAAGLSLTVWSARSMIIVVAHQCIHRRFARTERTNDLIGEFVTAITVFQDLGEFKLEHVQSHHRPTVFATAADPPVQVLEALGFRPGMARGALWRRAWWVFLTPGLYLGGAWSRLRGNLAAGHPLRRAGFLAWAGFWLSLPLWAPNGAAILLVGFVAPVIAAAQLSALLDKMGEHAWLTPPDPAHGPRHYHVSASWARFCGDPLPPPGLSAVRAFADWSRWLARAVFYHLPARLFVVVGDLPSHDYHHRFPARGDWATAAYSRQREIDRGEGPPFVEIWGLGAAIDATFRSLTRAGGSQAATGASLGDGGLAEHA
jgi:fatty acid desaturase